MSAVARGRDTRGGDAARAADFGDDSRSAHRRSAQLEPPTDFSTPRVRLPGTWCFSLPPATRWSGLDDDGRWRRRSRTRGALARSHYVGLAYEAFVAGDDVGGERSRRRW